MMLSSSVHYRLQRKIKKAVPECVVNVYDIDDTAKMTEENPVKRYLCKCNNRWHEASG